MVNYLFENDIATVSTILLIACLAIVLLEIIFNKKLSKNRTARKIRFYVNILLITILFIAFLVIPNFFRVLEIGYSRYKEPLPAAKAFYKYLKNKNYLLAYSMQIRNLTDSEKEYDLKLDDQDEEDNYISYLEFKKYIKDLDLDLYLSKGFKSMELGYSSKKSKIQYVDFELIKDSYSALSIELKKVNGNWQVLRFGIAIAEQGK